MCTGIYLLPCLSAFLRGSSRVYGAINLKILLLVISHFGLFQFRSLVCALLLTLFFSLKLGWLPVSGRIDLLYNLQPITGIAIVDAWLSDSPYRQQMIINVLQHLILPV